MSCLCDFDVLRVGCPNRLSTVRAVGASLDGSLLPAILQGHLEQGVDRRRAHTPGPSQCQLELWRRGLETATDDTMVHVYMNRQRNDREPRAGSNELDYGVRL